MQIRSVILYSNSGEVRELPFKLGRVNVVSGPSGRGKSAIIAIVDYCLGRSKLGVPAGPIQDAVAWYAVRLDFAGERMQVARPVRSSPGNPTSKYHLVAVEGDETVPMDRLRATASRDDLAEFIGSRLGTGVALVPRADGKIERKGLTFRSALLYCLQKQNEIANPDLYFHRQAELAQTIRDTLPFYLGAISPRVIEAVAELRAARRTLRDTEGKLARAGSAVARRDDNIAFVAGRAREIGLDPDDADVDSDDYLTQLEARMGQSAADVDAPGRRLAELSRQLADIALERADVRKEIEAIERFERDQAAVADVMNEQRRRLTALHLMPEDVVETCCPLCEASLEGKAPEARKMQGSVRDLVAGLRLVSAENRDVREHLARRRARWTELNGEAQQLRSEVSRLQEEERATAALLERRNEVARLSGMVEMLKRFVTPDARAADDLEARRRELLERIEELEGETNLSAVKARTSSYLGAVGQTITGWARQLRLEYAAGFLTIDPQGPGLVSESADGTITFSRFGSGHNWVWYHILGHMALHGWFIENARPVPRFLILDQPSQVYFPSLERGEKEEDWQEVRRIYEWLFDHVEKLDGELQVIVTDHARFDNDRFKDHLQHDWWDGDALVPRHWLLLGTEP